MRLQGEVAAMNEIEAAAKAINMYPDRMRQAASALFVARVGCDQCGGIEVGPPTPCEHTGACNEGCPAVHVEIDNPYGGTVWADPEKCDWVCIGRGLISETPICSHDQCRYVPKHREVKGMSE